MTHFPCKAAKMFLLSAASAMVMASFANAEEFIPDMFDGSPAAMAAVQEAERQPEEYVPDTFNAGAQNDFFASVLGAEEFVPDSFDGSAFAPDSFDASAEEFVPDLFDGSEEAEDYVPDPFDGTPDGGDFFEDVFGGDYVPDPFAPVEEIPEESLPEAAQTADPSGPIAIGVVKTTGSDLRMREGPSSDTGIVTSLNKNCTLEVLEYSTEDWYKVAYNGMSGYVSASYLSQLNGTFEATAKVNAEGVVVREAPSDDANVRNTIDKGAVVTCTALENGWYAVKCQYGTEGYIRSDYLTMVSKSSSSVQLYSSSSSSSTKSSSKGSSVVSVAKKYLGVRYVYGGATPRAFDCSGFTMYVYRQFGYNFAHSASSQWNSGVGKKVYSKSALRAGDLVFFNDPRYNLGKSCSHVGIYIGNGQFIHASSGSKKVVISSLSGAYYSRYFKGGLHIL